jgi:hypothetical protein
VILLGDGTYTGHGNCDIDFRGKSIVVRSQDRDPSRCTIDCEGSALVPHHGRGRSLRVLQRARAHQMCDHRKHSRGPFVRLCE